MHGGKPLKWTPTGWLFLVTLHAEILGKPAQAWKLTGLVQSPLVFSATKLTIGPGTVVSLGGGTIATEQADGETSLVVRSVKPLRSIAVTWATDVAIGQLTRGLAETDGGDRILRIQPDEWVRPGHYEFRAIVTAVTEDGGQAVVGIPVSMFVVDDIVISPAYLVLDNAASGLAATTAVTVTSQLNESYVIENIDVDDAGTENHCISVATMGCDGPRTEHRLRVALQASDASYREHRVRLRCFYPSRRLSTNREFVVVEMPKSADAPEPIRGRHDQ